VGRLAKGKEKRRGEPPRAAEKEAARSRRQGGRRGAAGDVPAERAGKADKARKHEKGEKGHKHVDLFDLYESIHYREFKILLKAADFSDDIATEVHDYWKLARRVATQLLIHVRRAPEEAEPRHRDIVFLDTPDFAFYRNSFMLRIRRPYAGSDPGHRYELTLKFRSPDIGRAAAADVNPARGIAGRVKFKEEILLVGSELGGMRSIFSHTCQLPSESGPLHKTLGDYLEMFPGLAVLGLSPKTKIAPAARVPVQEVLYELGELGFRGAKTAKVDMAVWRNTETKKIMIGEFAYETHFRHYGRLHPIPKLRSERLYRLLQRETGAWVELGTTKTAMYYDLSGKKTGHDE
jgi:hypothetical protein